MKIKINLFKALLPILFAFSTMLLVACEPAAQSASQAFDNANSVIKSGSQVLFIQPSPTAAPVAAAPK